MIWLSLQASHRTVFSAWIWNLLGLAAHDENENNFRYEVPKHLHGDTLHLTTRDTLCELTQTARLYSCFQIKESCINENKIRQPPQKVFYTLVLSRKPNPRNLMATDWWDLKMSTKAKAPFCLSEMTPQLWAWQTHVVHIYQERMKRDLQSEGFKLIPDVMNVNSYIRVVNQDFKLDRNTWGLK